MTATRRKLRPQDVRFVHIRDHPWPLKYCRIHGGMVPVFHEHFPLRKTPRTPPPKERNAK